MYLHKVNTMSLHLIIRYNSTLCTFWMEYMASYIAVVRVMYSNVVKIHLMTGAFVG